ncbi:MAG: DUF4159 domain-containing protein [Planctomycetaceae bacterium]|nr:DUF4159 domain-containing protein [Planctomycetaceae bacterium]
MKFALLACLAVTHWSDMLVAQEAQLSDIELRDRIKQSMARGCDYLKRSQNGDGSWVTPEQISSRHEVGSTALAVMAQINCDVPVSSREIQLGLQFLRQQAPNVMERTHSVYEVSLLIMALVAAEEYEKDMPRIRILARELENSMVLRGADAGLWGYRVGSRGGSPDRSNGQYAVLALREAAYAGVEVSQDTWRTIHEHWVNHQNNDGGWGYHTGDGKSIGTMTVAGLSTIGITSRMLMNDLDVDDEGRPNCCQPPSTNDAMRKGKEWMARNFSVYRNPGGSSWLFYYLYGLERAGRLTNSRFFGRFDWYRDGARFFISAQQGAGNWLAQAGTNERDEILNTSMALLFLSKGLSRVVINKLDYSSPNGESIETGEWNRHPNDAINLVELIDSLPQWPPRLVSQTLTLSRLRPETAVADLNQAPVLLISGKEAPQLTDTHVAWLREFVDQGGFIFAVANCDGKGFDTEFRRLVERLFPQGDASLQRLTSDHPVFRSEYLLNADGIELWGVDFGCRTSIIYSPDDIGCLWQKWQRHDAPNRNKDLVQRIIRGTRIGVNVLAYATGREPPEKFSMNNVNDERNRRIERGLLEIAKLRHSGGWDTAPRALPNLLRALNEKAGVPTAVNGEPIPITPNELLRFPLVYMHGRYSFALEQTQREALRTHILRGGVLFADACCGSTRFDRSFRDMMQQTFPENALKQIPPDHELFSSEIGYDISKATIRKLVPTAANASMKSKEETGPPILEGIEVNGRMAVIYSRYDISCALEHQASLACNGYLEDDAARIATNVVLYALLKESDLPTE